MSYTARIVQLFVESSLREEEPAPLDFGIDPDTAPTRVLDTVPEPVAKPAAKPDQKIIDYYGQKVPIPNPRFEAEVIKTLDRQRNAISNMVKKLFLELYGNPKELFKDMKPFIREKLLRKKYKPKTVPAFTDISLFEKELPFKYEAYLQSQIEKIYYKIIPRYIKAVDKELAKDIIKHGPNGEAIPQQYINLKSPEYIRNLLQRIWPSTIKNVNSHPSHAENYPFFRESFRTIRKKKYADLEKDKGRWRSAAKDQAPQI